MSNASAGEAATEMPYVRGLDGLRAVAVLLVVLFHAGFERFSNGFIGVDVFFTLSGFLVCNALLSEYEREGSISLSTFFAKRIKRLLPTATVAVIATLAAFSVFGSPVLFEQHVRGARAAVLYHANFFQISEATDYFANSVVQSPFEHFWSLSIEEQFYIAFPLAFFAFFRVQPGRYYRAAAFFGVLAAGSLYLQFHEVNSSVAYLSTLTRVYQILAGVSLAFLLRARGEAPKFRIVGGLCVLFIAVLATEIVELDIPKRGVAVVMVAVPLLANLRFPRLLEVAPVVYLGKISYGIYLWHWPIVVLLQEHGVRDPLVALAVSGVGGTALAALCFHTFENFIRHDRSVLPRPTIAIGLALSVAGFLAAGPIIGQLEESNRVFVGATGEYLDRIAGDGAVATTADFEGGVSPSLPTLFTPTHDTEHHPCTFNHDNCLLRIGGSGKTVLAIGDSHLNMTTPIFLDWAERHDYTLYRHNSGGCSWIRGVARNNWTRDDLERCVDVQYVHRPLMIDTIQPDIIVLFSRIYDTHSIPSIIDENAQETGLSIPEHAQRSIDFYESKADEVIVIGSLPALEGQSPAVCLSRGEQDCSFPVVEYESNLVAQVAAGESQTTSYVRWDLSPSLYT